MLHVDTEGWAFTVRHTSVSVGQLPPSRPFKVEDDPARVVVKITEIRDEEIRYTLAVCQALLKRLKAVIEPRYL